MEESPAWRSDIREEKLGAFWEWMPRRLRYWERLRLVRPRARWGERFYNFGDLVALRTLQRLTDHRIPARRVRRAVSLIEQQFGESSLPLQELRFLEQGRDLLVIPPGATRPFSPLKQQWVFPFDSPPLPAQAARHGRADARGIVSKRRSTARRARNYSRRRSKDTGTCSISRPIGSTPTSIWVSRSISWAGPRKRAPNFFPPSSSIL